MKNGKSGEEAVKIHISQKESGDTDEKSVNQAEINSEEILTEVPLEKMTKDELLQTVKGLQEKSEKDHDLYLRARAEVDNILKRNKREKEEWVKFSNESIIKELLSVLDNLEMAISHSNDENSLHALREGVELTLKGLRDILNKSGLEEIKARGEPFDPCFHHAVSAEEDENVEDGVILKELQKGYTLHERLIRPAMVVLSKGKGDKEKSHEKAPEGVCEE